MSVLMKTYEVTLTNGNGATITIVMKAINKKVINDFVADLIDPKKWYLLKAVEV